MNIKRILIATGNQITKASLHKAFSHEGVAEGQLLPGSTVGHVFEQYKKYRSGIDVVVVDMTSLRGGGINLISNIRQYEEQHGFPQANIIALGLRAELRDPYLQKARVHTVPRDASFGNKIISKIKNLGF